MLASSWPWRGKRTLEVSPPTRPGLLVVLTLGGGCGSGGKTSKVLEKFWKVLWLNLI
jgi:hypothetical protein